MVELGEFALILGLFAAAYAVLIDLLGAWRAETGLIKSGRNATVSCWLCLTVAIIVLSVLLVRHDFSVRYVAEHTSKALPLVYRISALWAGATGSLLLWLWLQTGFVTMVCSRTGENEKVFVACSRAVANFVCVFFLAILILDEKRPFALSGVVPADGAGLNPLLQHPAMALHPPTLFIGYAAFVIPFVWAFALLMCESKKGTAPLFRQARNWILFAWVFLTVGIVLGAWWAYEELGWGGYWAWDPVENSSLMPWLTATALLHCSRTYSPYTSVATWLTVLALLTFSLCIFGTFLTRYGLVTSIHAFPEPGLGIMFMVLLAIIWVSAAVLGWRRYRNRAVTLRTSGLAGAGFVVLNNWLIVFLTIVIFIGTLFPFFSSLFTEKKIELGSEYFTKITAPLGLALLLLLGVCPHFLRHGLSRNRRVLGALLFSSVAALSWALTKSLAIPCFILCSLAVINLVADFLSPRLKTQTNERIVIPRRSLRWYGARTSHIGVVLIFFGIAGSGGYEIERQAALSPGQSVAVGKFNVKYEKLSADHGPNFAAVTADVTVTQGEKFVARLKPSQAYYYRSDKQTSEVDIRRDLSGDLYVALTRVDKSSGMVNLRVLVKPLINWIWIGSAALVLGPCLVLISFYRGRRAV